MKEYDLPVMAVPKEDWWINTKMMVLKGYLLLKVEIHDDLIYLVFIK